MQTELLEIYCAGLKSAADIITANVETTRHIQHQQLDALRSAMEQQARSVQWSMDVWSDFWRVSGGEDKPPPDPFATGA